MRKKLKFFIIIMFVLAVGLYTYALKIDGTKYTIKEDLIAQISANVPNYTSIDKMPEDLKNAILAVEDNRFYEHNGFDLKSLGRAVYTNIKDRNFKEGGSTLTQQLAKNLFLSQEKTLDRKFKELLFAIRLEHKYTKDEILEMYLNVIYYGSGAYGIENASQAYFNKNVMELSLEECAMLAGLPQAPSAYNPNKYLDKAKKRQEIVLDMMAKYGYISKDIKNPVLQPQ